MSKVSVEEIKSFLEEKYNLDEGMNSKPIKVKEFIRLLDKHGYAHEVEEIAFALKDEEFQTCGDMECIVGYLNDLGMSLKDTEKLLNDALN